MDSIRSLDTDNMARALQALAPEDRAGILSVGAAFHRLTVKKRLERAERKVAGFEEKYHRTLHEIEADGLPDNADYAAHEDYVEWHYWGRVLERDQRTLEALSMLAPEPT